MLSHAFGAAFSDPDLIFACEGTSDLSQFFVPVNKDQAELRKYPLLTDPNVSF